jgi:hypothetical protein
MTSGSVRDRSESVDTDVRERSHVPVSIDNRDQGTARIVEPSLLAAVKSDRPVCSARRERSGLVGRRKNIPTQGISLL